MSNAYIIIASIITLISAILIVLHHKKILKADKSVLILFGIISAIWVLPFLEKDTRKILGKVFTSAAGGMAAELPQIEEYECKLINNKWIPIKKSNIQCPTKLSPLECEAYKNGFEAAKRNHTISKARK